MAHVPDETVLWTIENPMQRDGHFHHAEVRREMTAVLAENVDQFVADFLRQRLELLHREHLHIRR